jgi:hypothetical protein
MSKSTRLTLAQWSTLRTRIKAEHGLGTVLVRSHMKEVMGFLPREHHYWSNRARGSHKPREVVEMHLDWYSEPKRTMFLLKYGDIIDSK